MKNSSYHIFQHITLLYAEDDIISRTLYLDYFSAYFKNIYTAKNGQEALTLYKEKKPDVIILDIYMPILTGLDVCKKIRENDQETKIILLTAHTNKDLLLEAIELGLTTYLEKPITRKQLDQAFLKLSSDMELSSHILIADNSNKPFFWDKETRELSCCSNRITLTKKEKLLLELLATTLHKQVSYEKIYQTVWFEDYNMENYNELSIRTLIKKLRKKLPKNTIKNTYGYSGPRKLDNRLRYKN